MRIGRPITAPLATHEAKDTGVHGVGTNYIAESSIKDINYASHKARHQNGGADEIDLGGLNIGSTMVATAYDLVRRSVDSSHLSFIGGASAIAGHIACYGKDHPSYPGRVRILVPNAAKTAPVDACIWSGVTDSPEMIVGLIPVPRLKQAKGRVTGTIVAGTTVALTLNSYSFFPNIVATTTIDLRAYSNPSEIIDEVSRFNLYNPTAIDGTYWVRWDYLTSSGEPEIWVAFDKDKVVAIWQSEDIPSFRPPIDAPFITSLAKINLPLDVYNTLGVLKLEDVTLKPSGIALKMVDTVVLPIDKASIIKERKVIKVIPKDEELEATDPTTGGTIEVKVKSTQDIITWEVAS